jgi:Holliday junction resolvase RusA-like endonuclease
VTAVEFTCVGRAQTAGSKRSFAVKRGGKFTGQTATTDDNPRTKSWQAQVAQAAAEAASDGDWCYPSRMLGPLRLSVAFYFHRPRSHYRSGRNAYLVRDAAPAWKITRPDLLKLTRAIEDALTGVLWHDDAQVCEELLSKHYAWDGEPERVRVRVEPLADPPVAGAHTIPGQLELAS